MTGKRVIELIEEAVAMIICDDNYGLTYPSVEQPDDEAFYNVDTSYTDSDGLEYNYSFKVWEDDKYDINEDNSITLCSSDHGLIDIKLLEIKKLS
jgi:hypothetical protein